MLEQPKPPAANPRDVGGDVRQRVRVRRVQQRRISVRRCRSGILPEESCSSRTQMPGITPVSAISAASVPISPKASFPQSQGPEQVLRCQPSSMIICGGFSFPAQSEAM